MANPITSTAASLEAQVWETCHALQIAEKASTDDPQPDNVAIAYDVENLTAEFTITLPMTISASGGSATFDAATYLA